MAKRVVVEFVGETSSLDRAMAKVQQSTTRLDRSVRTAGAAVAFKQIGDSIGFAVGAASDLQEAMNKSNIVFGQSAAAIEQWSQTSATSFGLSQQAAIEAAATYGNMFDAMGLGGQASLEMSQSIVELGADLASFNNIDISDALDRLRSGLLGEQEAVERLGINMSETRLKAKALEMGMGDGKKVLDASSKAQAAYAIILEDTANAQGDFARTADSYANRTRQLKAEFDNLRATVGGTLLPVFEELTGFLVNEVVPGINAFLGTGTELNNWGGTVRDVIGDALGFLIGILQQTLRAFANLATKLPFGWGDEMASDFREAADAGDSWRDSLHASTEELFLNNNLQAEADRVKKKLLAQTNATTGATKKSTEAIEKEAEASEKLKDAQLDVRSSKLSLEQATHSLAQAQKEYNDYVATAGVDLDALADAQEKLIDVQKEHEQATLDVAKAQKAVNEALKPLKPREYEKAGRDVSAATDAVTKAQLDAKDAQDEYAKVVGDSKATEEERTRARLKASDAWRALRDAEDALAEAQENQTEISKQGTTASTEYKDAVEVLKEKEDALKTATDNLTAAQIAHHTAMGVSKTHADDLWKVTNDLAQAQLDLDTQTWNAEKATRAQDQAMREFNETVRTTWGNVIGLKNEFPIFVDGPVSGVGAHRTFNPTGRAIPALADGGIVRRPTLAFIGESGPEAVVPLGKGGATASVINITVNGAIDPASTARQIRNILNEDTARGAVGVW